MKAAFKLSAVVAIAGLAGLVSAGAALAQVQEAHLRIDGMT